MGMPAACRGSAGGNGGPSLASLLVAVVLLCLVAPGGQAHARGASGPCGGVVGWGSRPLDSQPLRAFQNLRPRVLKRQTLLPPWLDCAVGAVMARQRHRAWCRWRGDLENDRKGGRAPRWAGAVNVLFSRGAPPACSVDGGIVAAGHFACCLCPGRCECSRARPGLTWPWQCGAPQKNT